MECRLDSGRLWTEGGELERLIVDWSGGLWTGPVGLWCCAVRKERVQYKMYRVRHSTVITDGLEKFLAQKKDQNGTRTDPVAQP